MAWLRRLAARLVTLVRSDRAEREMTREIDAHLGLLREDYERRGLSPEQARVAARRAIGGVDQARERHRDERSVPWLEDLRRDIPYACRGLARTPGFTVAAVVTVALGIGATTTIFSVVNTILLRPLPYRDSDRLVRVIENVTISGPQGPRPARRAQMNQDEFLQWRERTRTFSHMAGIVELPATMATAAGPERVSVARVSPVLFEMLGVGAQIGRTLVADDERPDADAVVISEAAWRRHFGSDPGVLGRVVTIDNTGLVVVGVMPGEFEFPARTTAFWTALAPRAGQGRADFGAVIARLADAVSTDVATGEANAIGPEIRTQGQSAGFGAGAPPPPPPTGTLGGVRTPILMDGTRRFQVLRVKDMLVAPIAPAMRMLAAAVTVVLLIVCANVANLLLARGSARQREIGIRLAVGAGRGRIVRQILTESAVLSLAGGVLGAGLAVGGVRLVTRLATVDTPPLYQMSANLTAGSMLPRTGEIGVDGSMLAFALAASLLAGLTFGVAPSMFLSRVNYTRAIGAGASSRGGAEGSPRHHLRSALVVGQLVMATTLLVGGALLARSFVKLLGVDNGFDAANVLTFNLAFPPQSPPMRMLPVIEGLIERLSAVPGVESAGFTNVAPFIAITEYRGLFVPPGQSRDAMLNDPQRPQARSVSRGYLPTLGARLREGRWLGAGDRAGQANVLLINRALAERYFRDGSPVGSLVRMYRAENEVETWEIVGVVDDVRQARLDQEPFPIFYMDTRQMISGDQPRQAGNPFGIPTIAVRATRERAAVVADARAILQQIDPAVSVYAVASLEELISGSLVRPRFYAVLLGLFAGIAGVLAAVGIYGVLAFAVLQRTQEIGIRMALGARRGQVLALVLRHGLVLAMAGIVVGLAGAAAVTRYLDTMLFGLTPLDPVTFLGVAVLFTAVAALASYLPARRATAVDPLVALRE